MPEPDFLSQEDIEILKRTILKQFPEDDQTSFIRLCQRVRLDPFTRQIYATRRYVTVKDESGSKKKVPTLVPVTSVIGLTAVADRTNQYEGCEITWAAADGKWRTEWLEDEPPAAAKCVVFRKGRAHPEIAIARWMSYVGQTYNWESKKWELGDFWERMPDFMLGKCAKAAALRGAFPDPLNNVFAREELESQITDSELGSETLDPDEAKVMRNQQAEEAMRAAGTKFVSDPGPRVDPAKALEPAFQEDRIPEKPKQIRREQPKTAPAPVAPAKPAFMDPEPDDINLGPIPPAQQAAAGETPPEPAAPAQQEAPAQEPPWREYVIRSFEPKSTSYYKKKIGELSPAQLAQIEARWIPAIQEKWDDASEAQQADYQMFAAAIAHSKMAKPW